MTRLGSCGALLLAALLVSQSGAAGGVQGLRGTDGLLRAYDAILDARFDQVEAELHRACGAAPPQACEVLRATALWWRILHDPENRDLDAAFSGEIEKAIAACDDWADREPDEAEAWFYLGAAYAARVQWRVLRDQKVAAARDGKRIRDALIEAIELDPALEDAYFGLGLYKYYADVAPTAAKILRMLLFLPGGNREEGLREMLRARDRGRLLQGEADYQLHIIYLWYERRTDRAVQLLRSLHDHYPANPLFPAQIAEIQDQYLHDINASLATWRTLLAAAREQRVNLPGLAATRARLGIARQLETLHQTDLAIEHLTEVVDSRSSAPFGSLALAHLRLGEAHDRLGLRAQAVAAYQAALATLPGRDPYGIRRQVGERMRRAPDPRRAEAYRLALEAWRLLEHSDEAQAVALFERSLALNGADPVARYRYGRALQALHDDIRALAQFEQTIRAAKTCPAPVLGAAYLDAARLHERSGRRGQALTYYRTASTLYGAAADTRATAARALARLSPR